MADDAAPQQSPSQMQSHPSQYQQQQPQANVVIVQGPGAVGQMCPSCKVGYIERKINICSLVLLIICFPCGLLALLCFYDYVCTNCGFKIPKDGGV